MEGLSKLRDLKISSDAEESSADIGGGTPVPDTLPLKLQRLKGGLKSGGFRKDCKPLHKARKGYRIKRSDYF